MIDKIFIDTNILVYLFDKTERPKQTQAKKIISERLSSSKFFLSVQVINEFINILFSADMQHGFIVESTLTIVNPFEE